MAHFPPISVQVFIKFNKFTNATGGQQQKRPHVGMHPREFFHLNVWNYSKEVLITARIRRMRGGYVFSLYTIAGGGGIPARSRWEYPGQVQMRGTKARSRQRVPRPGPGEVPWPGPDARVPLHQGWGTPIWTWDGVGPGPGMWYLPCLDLDLGWGTPSPVRTTEGVLATRRTVCLLRSGRRTFLFENVFCILPQENNVRFLSGVLVCSE